MDSTVEMASSPIQVTVVTGFLGAGKSTLLAAWLQELPRHETAVIVNERGEVGVDGELLAAHVARLREIAGGCICCASQAELVSALKELSQTAPRPVRILVETSGAASPAGVIRAIGLSGDELRLDGVVTVLDVTRFREALAFDLTVEQLGFADVVVLSHVDQPKATAAVVEAAQREAERHAPAAVIVQSERGSAGEGLVALLARRAHTLHVPDASTAHRDIQTVALQYEGELDEDRFADWVEESLATVEARLLRIKGILAIQGVDSRVIVQGVGPSVEVQLGSPWGNAMRTSRMVVLGLAIDATALETGFRECAAGGVTQVE